MVIVDDPSGIAGQEYYGHHKPHQEKRRTGFHRGPLLKFVFLGFFFLLRMEFDLSNRLMLP
jgi:hypothetical protein